MMNVELERKKLARLSIKGLCSLWKAYFRKENLTKLKILIRGKWENKIEQLDIPGRTPSKTINHNSKLVDTTK